MKRSLALTRYLTVIITVTGILTAIACKKSSTEPPVPPPPPNQPPAIEKGYYFRGKIDNDSLTIVIDTNNIGTQPYGSYALYRAFGVFANNSYKGFHETGSQTKNTNNNINGMAFSRGKVITYSTGLTPADELDMLKPGNYALSQKTSDFMLTDGAVVIFTNSSGVELNSGNVTQSDGFVKIIEFSDLTGDPYFTKVVTADLDAKVSISNSSVSYHVTGRYRGKAVTKR